MKATVEAAANIAFVKYWGARDLDAALPENASISMTLDRCRARTTVEHTLGSGTDEVLLAADEGGLGDAPKEFAQGVRRHLDQLRRWAGAEGSFRVATRNNFPTSAGIASSAAGFAALAAAVAASLDRRPDAGELSLLARLSGSGSAARSVMGGYVRWPADDDDPASAAVVLAPVDHWPLCDLVAIVDTASKGVPSREGHRRAPSSPHFAIRQQRLGERLAEVERAILDRDLARLGPILEQEAIDLHLIAMSSRPPIFYWHPGTLEVLEAVRQLRAGGVSAWITMDAGPNVHVICEPGDEEVVARAIDGLPRVDSLLRDRVGTGPRRLEEHLF
ncbi:MAG: diphosphomevalonate decarboxylase [Thermoanaerobaculia bacterium]